MYKKHILNFLFKKTRSNSKGDSIYNSFVLFISNPDCTYKLRKYNLYDDWCMYEPKKESLNCG